LYSIRHTLKHIKRLCVQVSITFVAKYIVIVRLSVIGGGHLEFSHKKGTKKMETVFSRSLWSI